MNSRRPTRTASRQYSGYCSLAAEHATWRRPGSMPAARSASSARRYTAYSRAQSAASEVSEKCENVPVTRSDGAFFSSSSKPPSSSGAKPIRCSPVSILIWMAAGLPAASAAACSSEAKPARPHANVKFASTAAESCHGSALLMTRISFVIPAFRSASPSDTCATAKPATASSGSSTRAISAAPSP